MFGKSLTAIGLLALSWSGSASAANLVPLNGKGEATTQTLGFDGNVETELVRGGGHGGGHAGGHGGGHWGGAYAYRGGGYRGGYGGGYRGGYGGGYRGWGGYGYRGWGGYGFRGWGGYGGYRGYYRPFYGYGYSPYAFYRPFYYGWPYSNYYGGYYGGGYGGYPYYTTYNYLPANYSLMTGPSAAQDPNYPGNVPMMPPADNGDGTYPYNGGPQGPMPMEVPSSTYPGAPAPTSQPPRPTVPLKGQFVSAPREAGYSYLAYGEQAPAKTLPVSKTQSVSTAVPVSQTTRPAARFAYPAFGEQAPSTFATDRLADRLADR